MVKRFFDFIIAFIAIIILLPVFVLVPICIKFSSPGPVFHKAKRVGKNGNIFTMFKFRSMHINVKSTSVITGLNDSRIFPLGKFLRKTKIDELPQLINVLIGQMAIVGPRSEDVQIVEKYYTKRQYDTLKVFPGLASPGSLFNYTHGDLYLDDNNTVMAYVEKLLPIKLDLELYYVDHQSIWYDLEIMFRTMITILKILFGKKTFKYPKEFRIVFKTFENPITK